MARRAIHSSKRTYIKIFGAVNADAVLRRGVGCFRTDARLDRWGDGYLCVDRAPAMTASPAIRVMEMEDGMSTASKMLETYPKDLGGIDRGALTSCIEACLECGQACTACADACLSEDSVLQLTTCVRTNLDCTDMCAVTAQVLSRQTGYDANLTRAVLEACATACRSCADECDQHADHHEHCRICAACCRRCEQACRQLMTSLG